jgi:chemosensory pili system protein ChpB (putative protein-glutamate methylesterase)
VHEGTLATLNREVLDGTGAEVVVVNLDEDADGDLDRLYELLDGNHPRVVFNDAQASRRLDGWDRARWARHLAVKVMAEGDLDPPRPLDAPIVSVAAEDVAVLDAPLEVLPAIAETAASERGHAEFSPIESFHAPAALDGVDEAESESLAAELEALLAADEDLPLEDELGTGLKFSAEDDLPPLHDGHFGVEVLATQGPAPVEFDEEQQGIAVRAMPSFQLDHLVLAPLDESLMPAVAAAPAVAEKEPSSLLGSASAWALVDNDEAPVVAPPRSSEFGIEKLTAADFLAPEGGSEESSDIEPGMSLELVSIEEAIAPTINDGDGHEMLLGDLDGALSRVLVLGAAADSVEAVCTFLSQLPSDLRLTVLHVQHMGGKSADGLAQQLDQHSRLPVREAVHGARARIGEVLVVPEGQQARLYRDGRIELQSLDSPNVQSSPIDASFTMAANIFGRSAQAIVFSGHANDALGGCQAIHDRGGQVWVEASSEGHFADMVHGIEAERLNSYSGTPAELAARLVEEMSMEGRR